jgi:uroporphyrin-III C-methyltransferase
MVLCTGVGRGGKGVRLPGYLRERSTVILMGVARLKEVVDTLVETGEIQEREDVSERKDRYREGASYPKFLPIAIIERASSPDQRVIKSTLENIVEAIESNGEQRPPGMMIVGWSVLALDGEGDVGVLDDSKEFEGEELENKDRERVRRWLDGRKWNVREGLSENWTEI